MSEKTVQAKKEKRVPAGKAASEKKPKKPVEAKPEARSQPAENVVYAVVRLRGSVDMNQPQKDAMKMLNLHSVNNCVIVPGTPDYKGMLNRARNWITWGEVSPELESKIKARQRGKTIHLHPPRKGLKSTKCHFPKGDLGYRGEKINDLLRRMI